MVMLHINFKGITNAATWQQIFFPADPPPLTLEMGSIGQQLTFSELNHAAYEIKGNHEMQQNGSKDFALRPPPLPPRP